MAGNIFVAGTSTECLLASSSEKTVIRITTPASMSIKIKEWGVFFDGASVTAEPVVVKLMCSGTTETGMATSVPTRRNAHITASQCVVMTMGASCSTQDSSGVYCIREVHPQSGYQEKFSYGDEIVVSGTSGTIALHVNAPASVYVHGEIVYEE